MLVSAKAGVPGYDEEVKAVFGRIRTKNPSAHLEFSVGGTFLVTAREVAPLVAWRDLQWKRGKGRKL